MKLRITLFKLDWSDEDKRIPPQLMKLRQRFAEMFAAFTPKLLPRDRDDPPTFQTHEMTVPVDAPRIEKLLQDLHRETRRVKPKAAASAEVMLSPDELKRARFLPLVVYGDYVDEDSNDEPLNPTERVLCKSCGFPDIRRVPQPLLVSKAALKKQDVFSTTTGMLVVRPRVLGLLQKAIEDQIEVGEAVVARAKKKATGSDRLFWVRPRHTIGDELNKHYPERCRACKRPLEAREGKSDDDPGPGLWDGRKWVGHFGTGKADLAVLDGFYGEILDSQPSWYWQLAISGALFTYLKSNGVTGIAVSDSPLPNQCFFSKKGEPTLESKDRTFGSPNAAKKASLDKARVEKGRAVVRSVKHVPWDFDGDGYAYFYLTTPELIVLDPMSWEQDSDGPYRVKNFSKPGLYRLHAKAIKGVEDEDGRGVSIDSATLLFVDNAFFASLQEAYDWEEATKTGDPYDWNYHNQIAEEIGSRFGICTPGSKIQKRFRR